jgi:DNA primase
VIPQGFIQDLLARADIVDVVGRAVQLKKAGINYKGLCPFHGEKSPSFIVSPSRQTYHCFGCGVHGNAVGFLMEHSGLGFVEAVKDLAQDVGMTVPDDDNSPEERARAAKVRAHQTTLGDVLLKASNHYRAQLKDSPRAVAYLKGRGLTGEIAKHFALGYAPGGWHGLSSAFGQYDDPLLVESGLVILQGDDAAEQRRYDRFRDRIMFPIRNPKGEVIGFGGRVLDQGEPKYLNSPETPVFSKGRELYGLFEARAAIRQRGFILVTEGYMDVVALAQLGFGNAVATLGTACTGEHIVKMLRFSEQIVFSFDGDAAGRRCVVPCERHAQLPLPVPAGRARSRLLHPRAWAGGVRGLHPGGVHAVAAIAGGGRRRLRPGQPRGPRTDAGAGAAAVRTVAGRAAEGAVAGRTGARWRADGRRAAAPLGSGGRAPG